MGCKRRQGIIMTVSSRRKIREIYELLPKLNCGLCGFDGCGQFARAVAEGRASPFGCREDPGLGYAIARIVESEAPTHGYSYQPSLVPSREVTHSPETLTALGEEVRGLSRGVDDILARIEDLKRRR